MGIEKVGFGGQKLSSKVFKKAKYFSQKFPEIKIQIDGGVKIENSFELFQNGVSRFVSGSGIFKAKNIKKQIENFKKEIK
jgi:ribulose-phosphate 3-epimerase